MTTPTTIPRNKVKLPTQIMTKPRPTALKTTAKLRNTIPKPMPTGIVVVSLTITKDMTIIPVGMVKKVARMRHIIMIRHKMLLLGTTQISMGQSKSELPEMRGIRMILVNMVRKRRLLAKRHQWSMDRWKRINIDTIQQPVPIRKSMRRIIIRIMQG